MHIALIANTAWLDEELPTFKLLTTGFMADNIQITQILPQKIDQNDTSSFSKTLKYIDTKFSILRNYRITALHKQLAQDTPHIIHALDGRLWQGAVKIAQKLEIPAILSANSHFDISLAPKYQQLAQEKMVYFTASSDTLKQAILDVLPQNMSVKHIAPSIYTPLKHTPRPDNDAPLCAVVAGNGIYDQQYEILFAALKTFTTQHPEAQFFLDGQGPNQDLLWKAAKRFELLPNISFVARKIGHRELLLGADLIIQPQALGRTRSLILQAMAKSIPIIAKHDPNIDLFHHNQNALVISSDQPKNYVTALNQIINDKKTIRQITINARQYTRQNHAPSVQVQKIIELYTKASAQPLKFPS